MSSAINMFSRAERGKFKRQAVTPPVLDLGFTNFQVQLVSCIVYCCISLTEVDEEKEGTPKSLAAMHVLVLLQERA